MAHIFAYTQDVIRSKGLSVYLPKTKFSENPNGVWWGKKGCSLTV